MHFKFVRSVIFLLLLKEMHPERLKTALRDVRRSGQAEDQIHVRSQRTS